MALDIEDVDIINAKKQYVLILNPAKRGCTRLNLDNGGGKVSTTK